MASSEHRKAEMAQPNPGTIPGRSTRDDSAKEPPEIEVRLSWCKSCGLCVEYCNREVLEMDGGTPKVVQAERCTRCLQCENICPDFAIEVHRPQGEGELA